MAERTIVMTFDVETGEVLIDAQGFEGEGCAEATKPYEQALGKVVKRTRKPEAYGSAKVGQRQGARG